MGDVRNTVMNRSSYTGSVRKDYAEEVAKRRAAIQQEIEARQKLARKLQDEKMARAVAQKEGRLLKQRKAQQREMLRAKAVLDRRTQILAEKEREKKEAILSKARVLASCLTPQHKSRPTYAFGSSTPRELEYLTHLTREQKVYDRKLMPSDRSLTAASGSSSHSTLTPTYDSRDYIGASMTGSLYIASSELKTNRKLISNCMTQSLMTVPKPIKTMKFGQKPVYRQSVIQRPITATKTTSSIMTEMPIKTEKLVQQHVPPLYVQKSRFVQSKPETKIDSLKTKPVPGRPHKSAELKTNNEAKAEAVMNKSPSDDMHKAIVIMENNDIESNGKCVMVEVSDEEERRKTASCASEVVEDGMLDGDADMKEKIILAVTLDCKTEATTANDAPLFDLSLENNGDSVNEAKTDTAVMMVNVIVDQETEMCEKQEKENDILKRAQIELQVSGINCGDPVTVYPNLSEAELVNDEQGEMENTVEVFVEKESLVTDESLLETGEESKQKKVVIQKLYEIVEDNEESGMSTTETSKFGKEEVESSAQNKSTVNADGIETVTEDLKLAKEKNSVEEKRRIQDELLEREQREREVRKAKLVSIMSRTRGGAPSVAVIPPVLHTDNSEIESLKHRTDISLSSECTPVKSVLSHTTASVLQKLATTNPKLLSVLQRNGSNRSLADELSAADRSLSVTLPGQPVDSIVSHEGSTTIRHLPFEPDINHRPVAMK
ncbi:hypothetical protein WUBG_00853 [Wuchereria bancrofti]|uniref:Uncharacterized protein n=1 Tax=Wuchereria bancrofti TaxID=6293 RepID=J9F160_WUCBA|nr:hypothetical protein WUBG_00853 [Wuchereria bancrofti]